MSKQSCRSRPVQDHLPLHCLKKKAIGLAKQQVEILGSTMNNCWGKCKLSKSNFFLSIRTTETIGHACQKTRWAALRPSPFSLSSRPSVPVLSQVLQQNTSCNLSSPLPISPMDYIRLSPLTSFSSSLQLFGG